MPRTSEKKVVSYGIESIIRQTVFFDDSDAEEEIEEMLDVAATLQSSRYLNLRKYEKKIAVLNVLFNQEVFIGHAKATTRSIFSSSSTTKA